MFPPPGGSACSSSHRAQRCGRAPIPLNGCPLPRTGQSDIGHARPRGRSAPRPARGRDRAHRRGSLRAGRRIHPLRAAGHPVRLACRLDAPARPRRPRRAGRPLARRVLRAGRRRRAVRPRCPAPRRHPRRSHGRLRRGLRWRDDARATRRGARAGRGAGRPPRRQPRQRQRAGPGGGSPARRTRSPQRARTRRPRACARCRSASREPFTRRRCRVPSSRSAWRWRRLPSTRRRSP
jgi:hypothetical protein